MATADSSEDLSSQEILESLHEIDEVRSLRFDDFEKGYLELLSTTSSVSDMTYSDYILRLTHIHQNRYHTIWVIEDIHISKIIACATLVIEPKFNYGCCKKAHIRDLVIHPEYIQYGYGVKLMKFLRTKALSEKCYELSINCSHDMYRFYHQHGFSFANLELSQKLL